MSSERPKLHFFQTAELFSVADTPAVQSQPMSKPEIQENGDGVLFTVKVVPGSSRTAIAGILDDMIKIRVAAAPEKGKANQCLLAFLAKRLSVKKNAMEIVSGQTHPVKRIRAMGISAIQLADKLGLSE